LFIRSEFLKVVVAKRFTGGSEGYDVVEAVGLVLGGLLVEGTLGLVVDADL
jgi:hypothetical protein